MEKQTPIKDSLHITTTHIYNYKRGLLFMLLATLFIIVCHLRLIPKLQVVIELYSNIASVY